MLSFFRWIALPRGAVSPQRTNTRAEAGITRIRQPQKRWRWVGLPGLEEIKKGAEAPFFTDQQAAVACGSKFGAGNEARTRDLHLGKVALYQLSYSRIFLQAANFTALFLFLLSAALVCFTGTSIFKISAAHYTSVLTNLLAWNCA